MKKFHKSIFSMWGMLAGFLAANSLFFTYGPVYMRSIGIDNGIIGLLTGLPLLLTLFVQPIFGLVADRASTKNKVFILTLLVMITTMVIFPLNHSIWWVAILTVTFTCLQASANPLMDSICFESANLYGYTYGTIRLAGCCTMISMLIGGPLMDVSNVSIFYVYAVFAGLCLFCALKAPKVKGHQHGGQKTSLLPLLKNKKLMMMVVPSLLIYVSVGFYNSFFGIHFTSMGASNSLLAIATLFSIIIETPVLLLGDKLYKKFGGPYWFIIVAALCAVVKGLILGRCTSIPFILVSLIFLSGTNILTYLPMSTYFNENAPLELKASSLMLFAVAMNVGKMLGSVGGGFLNNLLPLGDLFILTGCISLCAALWVSVPMILERRRNGKEPEKLETNL